MTLRALRAPQGTFGVLDPRASKGVLKRAPNEVLLGSSAGLVSKMILAAPGGPVCQKATKGVVLKPDQYRPGRQVLAAPGGQKWTPNEVLVALGPKGHQRRFWRQKGLGGPGGPKGPQPKRL